MITLDDIAETERHIPLFHFQSFPELLLLSKEMWLDREGEDPY